MLGTGSVFSLTAASGMSKGNGVREYKIRRPLGQRSKSYRNTSGVAA